jgi:hypothetical protein
MSRENMVQILGILVFVATVVVTIAAVLYEINS